MNLVLRTNTLHANVIALINRAYHCGLLPRPETYRDGARRGELTPRGIAMAAMYEDCRNTLVSTETVIDALQALAAMPHSRENPSHKTWGKFSDGHAEVNARDLVSAVALNIIRRCERLAVRLTAEASQMYEKMGRVPVELFEKRQDFAIPSDAVAVLAILNIRSVFLAPETLNKLLTAYDAFQGLLGRRTDLEAVSVRLRAIVRPVATRHPVNVAADREAAASYRDSAAQVEKVEG